MSMGPLPAPSKAQAISTMQRQGLKRNNNLAVTCQMLPSQRGRHLTPGGPCSLKSFSGAACSTLSRGCISNEQRTAGVTVVCI